MKKVLKWTAIILGVPILLLIVAALVIHEPKPEGQAGEAADRKAREMMAAVHADAWDSTRWVSWNFMGMHDFVWDKERHLAEVRWADTRVLLDPNTASGQAWEEGQKLEGDDKDQAVRKALEYFFNDSFWLNPVVKAFDPGTIRSLVDLEEGGQGVMVTYTSGGVTPGDSYLWILDENNRPVAWKMWVDILPIGGVQNTWEAWETLPTGALVATRHNAAIGGVSIDDLKGGMQLADIGLTEDPFAEME